MSSAESVTPALWAAASAEAAAAAAQCDVELTDASSSQQAPIRFPLAEGESPIGRLYKDAVQRVFSFLTPAELALTHSVSQLWRAAHDSERQARWLVTQILPRTIKRLQAELSSSSDEATQVHALVEIRTLLSRPENPPISEVIATPVLLPRLVQILQSPVARLQLTNVASGTPRHSRAVLEAGLVPILVRMLANTNAEFADATEQAVWAIGNLAGDSAQSRDFVLHHGALPALLALFQPTMPLTLMRNITWPISNLCRGKPQPEWETTRSALPTLKMLMDSADEEVQTDAAWALSYISDDSTEGQPRIPGVIATGVVPRLVELLGSSNVNVVVPCLRTLGNLACGSDADAQAILSAGFLSKVDRLLSHPKKGIRRESTWSLSSVLAGPRQHIQAVLDAQLMETLIKRLKSDDACDVRGQRDVGRQPRADPIVASLGGVTALCTMLGQPDPKINMVALDGLRNFLQVGQLAVEGEAVAGSALAVNPYVAELEECGGVEKLEALQHHANEEVYQTTVALLETYFPVAMEQEDGEPATATADQQK